MPSARTVQADQIQQWEKKDPDNIDEMPIEAKDLDVRMILGCESAFARVIHQPDQQTKPYDHVQRMHSRHRKVQTKEQLSVLRIRPWIGESHAGDEFVHILMVVFNSLNTQKCQSQ